MGTALSEGLRLMFSGTWRVVASPDLDDEYLRLQPEGEPHVKLRQRGRYVQGEYQIGLLSGEIDGRLHGDQVLFSLASMDEEARSPALRGGDSRCGRDG